MIEPPKNSCQPQGTSLARVVAVVAAALTALVGLVAGAAVYVWRQGHAQPIAVPESPVVVCSFPRLRW